MSTSRAARVAFTWLAWLFVVCVVVQFFLAGLGVFAGEANFATHRDFGYTFGWLLILMLIAGIVGRTGRFGIGGALVLIVLFALQSVLVALRESAPAVAALHPLNGVAIFTLALWLARSSMRWPASAAAAAEPTPAHEAA
jgi:mercuric ion transport protein